jgi:hypothetical protein
LDPETVFPGRSGLSYVDVEDVMALTLEAPPKQETIPETMRAAVLFGPRDIRQVNRPVPRPGPGEVLVKVAMCGTCGTDLKIYDGHFVRRASGM